jgi:hypothetical protein
MCIVINHLFKLLSQVIKFSLYFNSVIFRNFYTKEFTPLKDENGCYIHAICIYI